MLSTVYDDLTVTVKEVVFVFCCFYLFNDNSALSDVCIYFLRSKRNTY